MKETTIDSREITYLLARLALDKRAQDPVLLDVSGLASYADYFLICSGSSSRQVQAISDWLERESRKSGIKALSVEGQTSGKWVLLDFGAVLVHVFLEPLRGFYDLEGLWADAPRLPPPSDKPTPAASASASGPAPSPR